MKRSRLLLVVLGAFVVFGVAQSGLGLASSAGTATITADKADYSPGSVVTLTGASWAANEAVHVVVDDSASQSWSYEGDVSADAAGAFTTQVTLPSYFVANYTVTATGATSGTATTTFTDNVAANLDQCQNIDLSHIADPCGTAGTGHPS